MGFYLCVGFFVVTFVLIFFFLFRVFRKIIKESLAQTFSVIIESFMGISRMMFQQVQQSEEVMQTLGKVGFGEGRFFQRFRFQSFCFGFFIFVRRFGFQFIDLCVWFFIFFIAWFYLEWDMLFLFFFGFYSCIIGFVYVY